MSTEWRMSTAQENRTERLKILLLAEDQPERAEVRAALAQLGQPKIDVLEGDPRSAELVGSGEIDAMIVVFSRDADAQIAYLQRESREAEHPVLLALLRDRSYSMMRNALRAGAEEVLFLPLDQTEAASALLK